MKRIPTVLATCIALAVASSSLAARYQPNDEPVTPIQPVTGLNVAEVELGKKLFFEPRLSRSGFISCNSCHNLSTGGVDNLKSSIGDKWQQGPINSPTVLNSSLNFVQFWDGRAADLQEQAAGPIANPMEMAFTHHLAVDVLSSIPEYKAEFKTVFGTDTITIERITQALATFEKTLVTPNARFDRWLKGDTHAINDQELRGYLLFKESGCISCHHGEALGGNSFQKMGLLEPYVTDNESAGRAGVSGKDADRMLFKVPTLRNVALTYPYFHDGAAQTLGEAVDIMGRLQLGRQFSQQEIDDIVAFLKTLTGDQPQFMLPILPPSSDNTPRANPWAP